MPKKVQLNSMFIHAAKPDKRRQPAKTRPERKAQPALPQLAKADLSPNYRPDESERQVKHRTNCSFVAKSVLLLLAAQTFALPSRV